MNTVERINAYAQAPQSVPVDRRLHVGSAMIGQRRAAAPWPGFATYAEQVGATRTLWRRVAKVQTRARNRLDWTTRDRSEKGKRAHGETGSAMILALLLVMACFLTAIGIGAELVAKVQGIG